MYVTRSISHYKKNPESLSLPPEGPNSGYLVIQDEESVICCCFGCCKDRDSYLTDLPFPQNKKLTIIRPGKKHHRVSLFPVLNQPLSSNLYYAIEPHGKRKGKAYACSKKEDMTTCCFCSNIKDVKPRPFDSNDTCQKFQIVNYKAKGTFYGKSVVQDAFPPNFLRRELGWRIKAKTPRNYKLGEAPGLDSNLRARLPDLNFPLSHKSSKAVVIGKWYCPFMFVKDGRLTSREQVTKSMFYEMTLEQRWEQIFERDNNDHSNVVMVDVVVEREVVFVGGGEAVWDEKNVVDNTVWFKSFGSKGGEEESVGLSLEIFERMKWEQGVGYVDGDGRGMRVKSTEFGGAEGWKKFGCYVLVEKFVLKRMDRSLVMTCDFKHTHQLRCLWE